MVSACSWIGPSTKPEVVPCMNSLPILSPVECHALLLWLQTLIEHWYHTPQLQPSEVNMSTQDLRANFGSTLRWNGDLFLLKEQRQSWWDWSLACSEVHWHRWVFGYLFVSYTSVADWHNLQATEEVWPCLVNMMYGITDPSLHCFILPKLPKKKFNSQHTFIKYGSSFKLIPLNIP